MPATRRRCPGATAQPRHRPGTATPAPSPEEISLAFWQACHGGQRRAAEYLLRHGADINATPAYAKQTALDVAVARDTRRDLLATWLSEQGAQPSNTA